MRLVEGQTITGRRVVVDGNQYIDCLFIECELVYRGASATFSPRPGVAAGSSKARPGTPYASCESWASSISRRLRSRRQETRWFLRIPASSTEGSPTRSHKRTHGQSGFA